MAFGLSWAIASDVVVLHPANLPWSVTFGPDPVASVTLRAYSSDGGQPTEKTLQTATSTAADYNLIVEGGDPAVPGDTGKQYTPYAVAYFADPAETTWFQVGRNTQVTVDNPTPPQTLVFSYPDLVHANVSVDVLGNHGEQIYYSYYTAWASVAAESYSAQTSVSPNPRAPSSSAWVPMVRTANVSVQGQVYVVNADGETSTYNLSQQLDLSQGSAAAHWTIDLQHQGQIHGQVALTGGAANPSQSVIYSGVYNTTSAGVSGQVTVTDGSYAVDLPPGPYDLYVRSYASNQYADTRAARVVVTDGSSTPVDFIETLATGHAALVIDGFYQQADLSFAQLVLSRQDPGQNVSNQAVSYALTNGEFALALPSGVWLPSYTVMGIAGLTDPNDLSPTSPSTQSSIYHFHGSDSPAVDFAQGSDHSFAGEHLTLVKSNVFFGVAQAAGAPATLISNPSLGAYKTNYNPDGSYNSTTQIYAYGSSIARPQAAFTVVGEPGTYTLDARAQLPDGTQAKFGGNTITFGVPVQTPGGSTAPVVLTPPDAPDRLNVNLTFSNVTAGGVSSMVESSLGPAPPEGFQSLCQDPVLAPGDPTPAACAPVYYDIKTTAQWTGQTKVCVQRTFVGVSNGAADNLFLSHYKEGDPQTPGAWEVLDPPPGEDAAFDCSIDSSQCGCTDDASCGIDLESDPQVQVFRICGMTSSFSPFAVFQNVHKLTNTVGGQTYTGAIGPPALQTWTASIDGRYRITANGASGAAATKAVGHTGGCGAEISSELALHAGDALQILVGQQGIAAEHNAGGGGGTFVVKNGTPVLIAGGGGGVRDATTANGRDASLTPDGVPGSTTGGYTSANVAGGTGGLGGARVVNFGSGGGGWQGNGASDGTIGEGGFAFLAAGANQGKGGAGKGCGTSAEGGYGGGGAGNGCFGGGGGGGYSGGGGGRIAGGGGSLITGAAATSRAHCTASGQGQVTIRLVGKLP